MSKKPLTTGRISRLAANPATRAALADKYLTKGQLKQRQMNQRLDAPITPGSALTGRELAHQAQTATQVQYGPQEQALKQNLGNAKQYETNTDAWYGQYEKALQGFRDRIAGNNTDANTAMTDLVGAVGKLGTGVEGTNAQGDAANAAAVRQQLLGSFAALQNQTGRSSNQYAEGLAGVVGPGQKLAAEADAGRRTGSVRDALAALAGQEGAFNQKFRDDTTASEVKNVLAQQAMNINGAKANSQIAAASPAGKSAAAAATAEAQNAAKYGLSVHDWRMLGPDGRKQRINAAKSKPADSVYTAGPFAGRTKSEVMGWSPGKRASVVSTYNKSKKKPASDSSNGPEWLTTNEMNTGMTQVVKLKDFAGRAKAGQSFVPGHKPQTPLSRADAAKKIFSAAPSLKDPSLLTAALDAVYVGHLSPGTVKALISAGYKPSRVAKALGVPTAGQVSKTGRQVQQAITTVQGALS